MQGLKFSKVKSAVAEHKHIIIATHEAGLKKLGNSTITKGWSEVAKRQLANKTKDFKIAEESPFKTLQVHFESGTSAHIFVIPEKISAFDLHTSLTASFSGVVKSTSGDSYFVETTHLKKDLEKPFVNGLVSLSVLESWDYPKQTKKKSDKSEKKEKKFAEFYFSSNLTAKELEETAGIGAQLAQSTNLVRTLAETPSNLLKPNHYRDLVKTRAKENGYKFEFLDIKALEKLGAGSFLSVSKGDPDDLGGIVHLTYSPRNSKKRLALVGKGVCFDTGGYNIKTGNYMNGMHRDMTGSAVALGLFELLVATKAPYEVHCFMGLTENLISPHASRPNDLFFAANGTSIEMVNTDAEGRLVLADTLVIASREKPDLILDFATLTGSAVRALDTRRAAIFSNNDAFLRRGYEAGETSGERTWGFPIGGDYTKKLKSDVADLLQCCTGSNADHIYAATFLSHFVEKGIDWVHMDLSTDTNTGGLGLVKTETTGFGVRWGFELLKNFK